MATPEELQAARLELARREQARREQAREPERRGNPNPGVHLGIGPALVSMAGGALSDIPAGLLGLVSTVRNGPDAGAETVRNVQDRAAALTAPQTPRARQILEPIGQVGAFIEGGADTIGEITGEPTDTLGATGVKTALLGGGVLMGRPLLSAARRASARVSAPPVEPPSTRQLFRDGSQAFDEAAAQNVVLSEEGALGLGTRILDRVDEPDPILHPKSSRVVARVLEDAESGTLNFENISRLRQIANDARAGDPADARIAGQVVKEIDEYMANLSARQVMSGDFEMANQLVTKARDLWARGRRSEVIDEAFRKAELDAGDTGGAGFENKLRIRFRQIARNEKQFRQFTPEEQAAITRVAQGGAIDNTLRNIGKMAPTGIVSGALSGGLSAGIFGPFMGPYGGLVLPGLGLVGRDLATRRTLQNASRASEIIRQPTR